MIRATPEDSVALGLPTGLQAQEAGSGSFFDWVGVTLGFTGEGPARRIVGVAVVLLAVALLGWFMWRRRKRAI